MGNLPKILAILTLLGAVVLSIGSVVARQGRLAAVPTEDALTAAASHVKANFKPGDSIVVIPTWRVGMGYRLAGGESPIPATALHRGDRIDALDLAEASRVWVVALFHRTTALDAFGATLGEAASTEDFGAGVSVARYDAKALQPMERLTDELRRLRITRTATTPNAKPKPCRFRGTLHSCAGGLNVNVRVDDVFHRPVKWVFMQPGPGAAAATLTWPLKRQTGRQLALRIGNNLGAVRKPGGSPVTVTVGFEGKTLGSFLILPHEYTLERHLFDLPEIAASPTGSKASKGPMRQPEVTITLQAADPKRRYLLMEATVYEQPLPEALAATFQANEPNANAADGGDGGE